MNNNDPPSPLEVRLRAAQDELDMAQGAVRDAVQNRDAAIVEAYEELSAARIADCLNIDRQIIYRVLRRH